MRVYYIMYSCKSGLGLIVLGLIKFSWDATFPKTMSPKTQVLKILVRTLIVSKVALPDTSLWLPLAAGPRFLSIVDLGEAAGLCSLGKATSLLFY